MPNFTVKKACLLKDFLAQSLGVSATQAKKLLDAKKVFVNKQRVWIAGYRLKSGDAVETPDSAAATAANYSIAAEDGEYLIVHKPAGWIVNEHKNSLETLLQKERKNPQIRAAHRIDKDSSGVVIFAKNPAAFAGIVRVFQNFGVEKYYRGLAQGNLLQKFPAKFTLGQPVNGQSAETRIRVIKTNAAASYFEAQIITGRKHQIRIHLEQAGFPLLGEKVYQTAKLANYLYRQIPRQMLHAYALKFTNPLSGKILQAAAEEPADFQDALRLLQL